MKTYFIFPALIFSLLFLSNCKKENTPVGTVASDYFPPMKTGNYWVYKKTVENGTYPNYTNILSYDSLKIVRDTVIEGQNYFEFAGGAFVGIGYGPYTDSAGWIVSADHHLFPLITTANDTILQETINGGLLHIVYKTGNTDTVITVPAGSFHCTEMIGDVYYLVDSPPAPHTSPRQIYSYFSKDMGVIKTVTWPAVNSGNIISELHSYYRQY